jgi:hypothetical protein
MTHGLCDQSGGFLRLIWPQSQHERCGCFLPDWWKFLLKEKPRIYRYEASIQFMCGGPSGSTLSVCYFCLVTSRNVTETQDKLLYHCLPYFLALSFMMEVMV